MTDKFERFVNIIKIMFSIMAIIFIILTIILILWQLFGNSPTDIMIILSIIGIFMTFQGIIIGVLFQIKGDMGELKEFKRQTIERIKKIEMKE